MGKTGAGKSTLLNAIMQEEVAPTGTGQAITKENKVYSKKLLLPLGSRGADGRYGLIAKKINLYDTVGLEIDRYITSKTLMEIQGFLEASQKNKCDNDITIVWFCVNASSSRFELYEIDLIKKLSVDYEIPFVIVITRCFDNEIGELEKQIRKDLPEVTTVRVLAKDYKTRGGTIRAFGLSDLVRTSVLDYDKNRVSILESKLDKLKQDKTDRVEILKQKGKKCIEDYGDKALKIGKIPLGCIPFIHGLCIKMMVELNKLVGINSTKGFSTEIFSDVIFGAILTPLMGIPVVSAHIASQYVQVVGEAYLGALMSVIEKSNDLDLKNNDLMSKRIKEELKKIKN